MGRLLQSELEKYTTSLNGPKMLQQMYLYIKHHVPAMWDKKCPYENDSKLSFHAVGSDESLITFAGFVAWGFDINKPDIQCGHFCVNVTPKVHQVRRLIEFIEERYPDECAETTAYLADYSEERKAEVDAVISKYIEENYTEVSDV